ncbi:uracil-DNA glycosylase family protein [Deminuibacter soli]|uniref:DUF4918 family protein n=1 Tax=Deminuibacter soli TaxID=2291815 RepID=A0A3E1NIN4_9BACT|nr:uracil-DNA glycosylase family protein [Deminuibacter soli]RFM27790.1 DUF4918 family protein [Deminuibacter soli]
MNFATRVNNFNKQLTLNVALPDNIAVLNPFKDADTFKTAAGFYNKFYHDHNRRKLILGINPGRLGAGATGIPFTDPKRLTERCGIPYTGPMLHEPSSAFIYEMIDAFGGINAFYSRFYISSICPLGFVVKDKDGKEKNYNYFDSKALTTAVQAVIEWNIREQINMGCDTDVCFCMGLSKNYQYLLHLNNRLGYFGKIIPLEHPRFIMQYKNKQKEHYIKEYVQKLRTHLPDAQE